MKLGLESGRVSLANDHEAWAEAYRLEEARILDAIGGHVLDIRHVGATSISGVPAKPILDILIGVEDFESGAACVTPMQGIGYLYRGEQGIPGRHYFVMGDPRTHHVHLVARASEDWLVTASFRDFLRSHPDSAHEYAQAKEALAARYPLDRSAYQREKDEVIARLLERGSQAP